MSENTKVIRAAWVIGLATMLSRVFGYLRDGVIAYMYGAGMSADAFFVAFRIPNLLRRLFGEGTLTMAFIPVFTEYRERHGEKEAKELADLAFTLLTIILIMITVLGIVAAPWIISVLAPGFNDQPEKFSLAVDLSRLMFPYVLLVCLVALAMGVLNTLRHFFSPAFSPVILNVVMIIAALGFSRFFERPIVALAIGVVVAGVMQILFQLPFLKKFNHLPRPRFNFNHPGIKQIGLMMIPAILGLAVYNLNVLVSTTLASLVSDGAVSFLYYADRLMELPLGVFAIAFGTAVMPSMASLAAKKQFQQLIDTLSFALRMVFYIILPASAGLIVLRVPIISILFERGQFDAQATAKTADALLYYCLGLWAFSSVRILVPTFYALKDFWIPVKIAIVALIVNILAGLCLVGPLDSTSWPVVGQLAEKMNLVTLRHAGLALSTSLASMVQVGLLLVFLRRKIGGFGGRRILGSVIRSFAGAIAMGCVIALVRNQLDWSQPGLAAGSLIGLAICISLGALVYLAVTFLLRSEELGFVGGLFSKKFKGQKRS